MKLKFKKESSTNYNRYFIEIKTKKYVRRFGILPTGLKHGTFNYRSIDSWFSQAYHKSEFMSVRFLVFSYARKKNDGSK